MKKYTSVPFQKLDSTISFYDRLPHDSFLHRMLIPLGMILLLVGICTRLLHLTIVKGSYFSALAENNRIKEVVIEAPRGTIYDRKGDVLAISKKTREYPHGEALSHIVGYRQSADEKTIAADTCNKPLLYSDKVGRKGFEKLWECDLRGVRGKKLFETNAQGKIDKTLAVIEPQPGKNITSSLDGQLQDIVHDTIINNNITTSKAVNLAEQKIAVLISNPYTGEILALYSYPTFDPLAFELSDTKKTRDYLKDENQPLYNRALSGTYPPGSVFKPVVAAAALQEKVIEEKTEIEDTGEIKAGKQVFGNWFFIKYGRKDGMVNVVKAIQRSNDIFFYTIGGLLHIDTLKNWIYTFGYGKKTGIGLDEAAGLVPTAFWKESTLKERWYLGDTYNISIGQGYLLVTPLQVHQALLAFANGGSLCKPLLRKVGGDIQPSCQSVHVDKKHIDSIRDGMKKACETGGTAWPFFTWKLSDGRTPPTIGCKTGTAESKKKGHPPHAWFTAFAPFDHPEIAITVMVEEIGEGSDIAAPIAKTILTKYFER